MGLAQLVPPGTLLDAESFPVQPRLERRDVLGIARFDNAMDSNRVNVVVPKRAIVLNVNDAGAFFGDESGEARQAARAGR